jgi:hypothetical protein
MRSWSIRKAPLLRRIDQKITTDARPVVQASQSRELKDAAQRAIVVARRDGVAYVVSTSQMHDALPMKKSTG